MVEAVRIPIVILSEAEPTVKREKTEQTIKDPITAREKEALPRERIIPPTGEAPIRAREAQPIFGGIATPTEALEEAEIRKRGGKIPSTGVGAPIQIAYPESGFLPGQAPEGRTRRSRTQRPVASPFRDRTSGAPIQRENQFRKMQEQLKMQADELKRQKQRLLDNAGRIEKAEGLIGKAGSFVTNPVGSVSDTVLGLLNGLGPKGQIALAAIGAAVAIPETIRQIIKILGTKGLPLNRDWERNLGGNAAAFFSLDENKRRLIGEDAYVITQQARFEPDSGSETFNSLANRDEVLISRIGNRDKALGIEY